MRQLASLRRPDLQEAAVLWEQSYKSSVLKVNVPAASLFVPAQTRCRLSIELCMLDKGVDDDLHPLHATMRLVELLAPLEAADAPQLA